MDLLMMEALLYALFDLWFNSTAVSILLTYLVDQAFTYARRTLGQSAVARKTLVDERFLI
jgi:hypothetical protein